MKPSTAVPRRHMLAGSAAALTALGLGGWTAAARAQTTPAAAAPKPLPSYVAWKTPSAMIVHSPTTIETQFEQTYSSSNFKDTTKKTLVWKLSNGQWYIIKESNR